MKTAVVGCCHNKLDTIYDLIGRLEAENHYKVDLLLICGDLEAVRNPLDLNCMAVRRGNHKELGQFYKYYTGEKTAPVLTVVIGGNHEAFNYLWELYHGGWLAPNIYYLGHAGCVNVNGVRIAGASGIYKATDFHLGTASRESSVHTKPAPSTLRSVYHTREFNIRQLALLSHPDIFLSHDWPLSIEYDGDVEDLLKRESRFASDSRARKLGSPPLMSLLKTLQPDWWFSAHMHTRFEATVTHSPALPPLNAEASTQPSRVPQTKFLALDKCLPGHPFLEVLDIPDRREDKTIGGDPILSFDYAWLAIIRAFHPWFSTARHQRPFPNEEVAFKMVEREKQWLGEKLVVSPGSPPLIKDWQTFVQTAPGPGPELQGPQQPSWYTNPQTVQFCEKLQIPNRINPPPSTE